MQDHTPTFPENIAEYAPWVAKHGLFAPYGECQCGCGQSTTIERYGYPERGTAQGHPRRFAYNHHSRGKSTDSKFWPKVDKRGPDECWEWQAARQPNGYGVFGKKLAHRVCYELIHGPIPKGHYVCHRCDNPPCCNPAHLFAGTPTDNVQDMMSKGRIGYTGSPGESNPNAMLTRNQVVEIRQRFANGSHISHLAKTYGVGITCISRIVNRLSWKNVP